MPEQRQFIIIDPRDNVATAIVDLRAGDRMEDGARVIVLAGDVPFGHKFALADLSEGEYVIKYGVPIGRATALIRRGDHVHVHKDANPTPGNIAGGLTTLVEKSLGGVRKGGTAPIQGFLVPGEQVRGRGLWVMDTSMGLGACGSSDMLAGGAQIMAYTTGRGNPIGSHLGPVIKITATRRTVETLPDIIDFDATPVLYGEETIEACGMRLLDEFVAVANGKLTRAEESGHTVFAIGKMAV